MANSGAEEMLEEAAEDDAEEEEPNHAAHGPMTLHLLALQPIQLAREGTEGDWPPSCARRTIRAKVHTP